MCYFSVFQLSTWFESLPVKVAGKEHVHFVNEQYALFLILRLDEFRIIRIEQELLAYFSDVSVFIYHLIRNVHEGAIVYVFLQSQLLE